MITQSSKNPNSHLTVKERDRPSFPTRELYARGLISGKILDFGSGLGLDGKFLRTNGLDVTDYDPFYAPNYPMQTFDTILCNYVLNVLLPEEQPYVLMAVAELLAPTGKAYFTVRRDINRNGFRMHAKHGCPVYQCNVVLPYQSLLKTDHCEVYEYRHINQLRRSTVSDCPFCSPAPDGELITESATIYAMMDKYPVSPGHALIVPKQHIPDYFNLPERTKQGCWSVVDRVQKLIAQRLQPDGFNIGVNVGSRAGQTIDHVHIHLIPRYAGDVRDPTGGVRSVIPEKMNYLAQSRSDLE